eukprot:TRINITY_DN123618_c0_g1_i1.p1 TRINITY_DN123618_c0_g1~~TRINITY_DN123618_c0_g1_i1.p1  ORF type:complete len:469 (+),score=86.19 TRINITY_DN123618_c0_g1_i1:55-1461(+)
MMQLGARVPLLAAAPRGAACSSSSSTAPAVPIAAASHAHQHLRERPQFAGLGLTAILCTLIGSRSQRSRRLFRKLRSCRRSGEGFAQFSRLGPPLGEATAGSLEEQWRLGDMRSANPRVLCSEDDLITALGGLWQETLCIGTRRGLVRTLDMGSGGVVGDYYLGSHVPPDSVTALVFDGHVIVVGDARGRLHAFDAELPGSWGFAHSPKWRFVDFSEAGPEVAHGAAVSAVQLLYDAEGGCSVLSCSKDGDLRLWAPLGSASFVLDVVAAAKLDGKVVSSCLCAADTAGGCMFAATATAEDSGVLYKLTKSNGDLVAEPVWESKVGLTALAWDEATASVIVGLKDGSLCRWTEGAADVQAFDAYHCGEVLRLQAPSESGAPHLLSAGADGRVGVWDLATQKPLWGLCLQSSGARTLAATADGRRLVTNGLYSGKVEDRWSMPESWRTAPLPDASKHIPSEALMCFTFG